ncbi:signal transduction histidine kinase [Thioploca ingrica]|uniref:Sensory/regulatory protein RpfC n=1 Tax=Thioploca ingrica TaxID=40754 RepID=A0A090BW05_9GAMM|nr:signal transduction histidine kinase [Thioploca ingrica]
MYLHPFTVSKAVRDVNINIVKLHLSIQQIVLVKNNDDFNSIESNIRLYENKINADLKLIKERFLGDKQEVEDVIQILKRCEPFHYKIIALAKSGNHEQALSMIQLDISKHIPELEKELDDLIQFANNKATQFLEEAHSRVYQSNLWRGVVVVIIIFIGIWIARAESALRKSEVRLKGIFDNVAVGIGVMNPDGGYVQVNNRWQELFGYSATEVIQLHYRDVTHPDDRDMTTKQFQQLVTSKQAHQLEKRCLSKAGHIFWALVATTPIYNSQGVLQSLVSIVVDISERKQAESALRESEEKFRNIFEHSSAGIVLAKTNGYLWIVNPAWCQMIGYSADELVTMTFLEVTYPEDREASYQAIQKLLTQQIDHFQMEKRYVHKEGQVVWGSVSVSTVHNLQGKPLYLIAQIQDITARKQAENQLARERYKLFAVLDILPAFVYLVSRDYSIRFVNQRFRQLFGDPNGYPCYQLVNHYQQPCHNCLVEQISTLKIPDVRELTIIAGRTHLIYSNLFPATDDSEEMILEIGLDITERKQAEEALRQSEAQLKAIFDNAAVGIGVINPDGQYIQTNLKWATMLGYSVTELSQRRNVDITHPQDLEITRTQLKQLFAGTIDGYQLEKRFIRKDQSIFWGQLSVTPIRDQNGRIQAVIGIVVDITEHKIAIEALRDSERYHRILIDEATVGLGLFDQQGIIVELNTAFANIIGYSIAEAINKLSYQAITPPDYALSDQEQARLLQTSGRFGPYEKEFIHKAGHRVPVRLSGLIITHQGKPLMWVNVENITEQKRTEAQLKAANFQLSQFKSTLDMTLDGVYLFNTDTLKIFYVNQGGINQLGYTQAELLQMSIDDIKPPSATEYADALKIPFVKDSLPAVTFETQHRHKNGELIPVEVFLQYIQFPEDIKYFITIVRDITERKRTESQLRKAIESAERAKQASELANQAKSTFLAQMSHELRTPLNGILGYTQILRRDKNLSAEQQENIEIIHRSGEYLLTLINDILDLSKIEAGRIELYPTHFNLNQFLKGIINLFEMRARQKGICFNCELVSPLPSVVYVDETRLRQILINLLGNAIKFTQYGGVNLMVGYQNSTQFTEDYSHTEPITSLTWLGQKIRFQVEDTGIGIAQEELEKIFIPFQQSGDPQYRMKGTGLGLSITKKLVTMMGGELQVESQLNQGSTFWITLDLPPGSMAETTIPVSSNPTIIGYQRMVGNQSWSISNSPSQLSPVPIKILVVDDNRENCSVLVNLLIPLGFHVDVALNGQEAVAKAIHSKPDLILMDLSMPVMDGYEATRQIRQNPVIKEVIILAVSARVFETDIQQSRQAGCNDFIAKPIRLEQLLEQLHHYFNLQWIYDTVSEASVELATMDGTTPFTKPSAQQAAILFNLAKRGDLSGILNYVEQLKQDRRLIPFIKQIHQLANQIQLKQIRELVKNYL